MFIGGHRQWSVAKFEHDRVHLCNFLKGPARAIEQGKRRILIRAPVKSGKRQMVEYLAMRDNASHQTRKHVFLTNWHRTADEEQREELRCYGIAVFSGITGKKKEDYNKKIREILASGSQVTIIIHIDECDHGSGIRQAMSDIWRMWREDERIIFVLYSATPEEVIYSREITDGASSENGDDDDEEMIEEFGEGVRFDYVPPNTFCGPARFIDAGLVFESRPFFEVHHQPHSAGAPQPPPFFRLTAQGREIISDLRRAIITEPRRNVLILRLSYGAIGNKAIYQFLRNRIMFPELDGCKIVVDKDEKISGIHATKEKIQWSNEEFWDLKAIGIPIIIVISDVEAFASRKSTHVEK